MNFDPQTYWEEAESLFRQANQDSILSQISREHNIPGEELSIVNGVFHSYPLTQTIIWHGKILSKSGDGFVYTASLDGKPVDEGRVEVKESEARRLKYGKLRENLYYILQAIPDDHSVEVALATAGSDPGGIEEKLILIYLKALGYEPREVAGVNVIEARLTKRDILRLSQAPLDSLGSIHYSGQIPQP